MVRFRLNIIPSLYRLMSFIYLVDNIIEVIEQEQTINFELNGELDGDLNGEPTINIELDGELDVTDGKI
jgi:hypothetical protein